VDVLLQDELNHPSLFWINQRLSGRVSYRRIAIVHHLRSSELRPAWQNRLYAMVEKRYLKTLNGFVFNSQTTRQSLEQAGIDLHSVPWTVAYPAGNDFSGSVDEEVICQRAFAPGPLRVLFVGNVIERKGLHTLLDAIGRLPTTSVELDVIGSFSPEPTYASRIQHEAARLVLDNVVRFHGSLDHTKMENMLRHTHVLAVPSSYEGYGIVYVEGMGFGLPAIAGSTGAAWEIITNDENGYLVRPGDAAELANRLQTLFADRVQLMKMSIAALDRYRQHPTWEDMGRGVREFLLKVKVTQ
jgi:glycosyltransferase involved in cell wall biosynthesis